MKPYIYTIEQIVDFWSHTGKKYFIEHNNCEIFKLNNEQIILIKENREEFIQIWISIFKRLNPNIDKETIHNEIFWMNMYYFCEYNVNIYEYTENNLKWYFNTPDHPFEKYLIEILKPIDPYIIYCTEYPN
jgi:hypothetical protein